MFERLTKKVFICGVPYFIDIVGDDIEAENMTTYQIGMVLNRLAAYEDSGLPPEQVQELAKAKAEGHISPVKCPCDASEEAQELMNAKADGRMVELPCKVGDIGWQITECFDGDRGCQGNCDECPKKKTVVSFRFISKAHIVRHVEKGDIGKTVFLSREAAEKAIAAIGGWNEWLK